MNKSELIEIVAEKSSVSKAKAAQVLDAFVATVTHALKTGDGVTLIGFGSFVTAVRKARDGRNPKTGKVIKISESVVAKFRPGKALKEAVAGAKKKKKK